jgi:hypothetical protein
MKIKDSQGKLLTREEIIASGRGHLLPDANAFRCSKCHRQSFDAARGDLCNMTQPDTSICDGRFN